jgi:non-ribosomal peptide synthetase component E (peptide arylation enzyme)
MLNPGATLTFEELSGFLLTQKIAKFKLPEHLEIMSEFPVSGAGKILRRTLRGLIKTKIQGEQLQLRQA